MPEISIKERTSVEDLIKALQALVLIASGAFIPATVLALVHNLLVLPSFFFFRMGVDGGCPLPFALVGFPGPLFEGQSVSAARFGATTATFVIFLFALQK